jgi:hypothetical protein
MTPNDVQQELHEQLHGSGLPADAVSAEMTAHRRRRDASIDAATSTMSMRVQRGINAARARGTRSRRVQLAMAMTAAAAAIVLFVSVDTNSGNGPISTDSTIGGKAGQVHSDQEVDALADKLANRNSSDERGWTVTDEDVDQLLGETGLDL